MRAFALVCVVAACSSNNNRSVDAPGTADAPRNADASFAKEGSVNVLAGYNGAENNGQASAGFATSASAASGIAGTDGPCTAYNNTSAGSLDAGTIMIQGTAVPITLSASGNPLRYSAGSLPYPLFSAGATITFTGAGGADVGAFTGTATAPADVAGFTRPTTLSRAGFTATWTGGAGPGMWVLLAGSDGVSQVTSIICRVPDSGSFAIPASTFALLPAGENMGGVGVMRVVETAVSVGDTQVLLHVSTMDSSTIIPITQ